MARPNKLRPLSAPTVVCSHLGLVSALVERLRWSGRVVPLCCLAWVATSPAAASATAGGNR